MNKVRENVRWAILTVGMVSMFIAWVYSGFPVVMWKPDVQVYDEVSGSILWAEDVKPLDVLLWRVRPRYIYDSRLEYSILNSDGDEVNLVFQVDDLEKYSDSKTAGSEVQEIWDNNFRQEVTQMLSEEMEGDQLIEQINNLVKESGISVKDVDITYSKAVPAL